MESPRLIERPMNRSSLQWTAAPTVLLRQAQKFRLARDALSWTAPVGTLLLHGLPRSGDDELRNFLRMGDQREMAGLHFDCFGAHALSHEAFEIGVDRTIFRRDGIKARLRPPGRLRGLACEQLLVERLLDRIEHFCLRYRQVAREIAQERS